MDRTIDLSKFKHTKRARSIEVQQPDSTLPTAGNRYRPQHERKDLQRPRCHELRIRRSPLAAIQLARRFRSSVARYLQSGSACHRIALSAVVTMGQVGSQALS